MNEDRFGCGGSSTARLRRLLCGHRRSFLTPSLKTIPRLAKSLFSPSLVMFFAVPIALLALIPGILADTLTVNTP